MYKIENIQFIELQFHALNCLNDFYFLAILFPRYCLDGPVILYDEVTWFCEDCEPKPIVLYSLDESAPHSSETSDSVNLANNAIQAESELKNCIKKSNQQQQKKIEEQQEKGKVNSGLVTEAKVLLSDSRSSPELEHPQCSISSEQESESKNECGPVPRDAANSNVGPRSVQVSQVAASDDLNSVELFCHVDAQPMADPIWRYEICFATFV